MKGKLAVAVAFGIAVVGASYSTLLAQGNKTVWDGVYSEAQAAKGQAAYGQYCSSCHGDTLSGGEEAPPLAGGDFQSNWNEQTVGDLLDRLRTTMPLNKPGSLSGEVNAQILAYMFQVNKFPAGKADMANRADMLRMVKILAVKP